MREEPANVAFRATALQLECRAVNGLEDRSSARAAMSECIDRVGVSVRSSVAWMGGEARLFVLPEYLLTGFPMGESAAEWADKACLEIAGPEYEAMGKICQQHEIFLAGNAYEVDANFPGLYFQASFILGPSGDVVLRYRRLHSMFSPTPHDVWERYLDIYGLEGVFPVAETEIGRLAAVASEEILYPEIARCMAVRGAEVLIHSSCEVSSPRSTPKGIARRARAIENMAYVVSCNTAGMTGVDLPGASTDGGSAVIDFEGRILAEAGAGESVVASAEIDLAALRRFRRRPGMQNLLSRQRFEAYAETYSSLSFYPADNLEGHEPSREHFMRTQRETIERLAKLGVI